MTEHSSVSPSRHPEFGAGEAPVDDLEYDPSTDEYITEFDWLDGRTLTTTIVTAVGEVVDRPPVELEQLRTQVDPDALNEIFGPEPSGIRRSDGRLSFPYEGHEVTVFANGKIVISPIEGGNSEPNP